MIKLVEECRKLEKQAKQYMKKDPIKAINLYKKAAQCYEKQEDNKRRKSNYTKAAKLLRERGKSLENPEIAFRLFEESAVIYKKIGKERQAKKINKEAQKKFVKVAKTIRSEARKTDDVREAKEKFALASRYFIQGDKKKLSQETWVDSGDKFFRAATEIEDPIQAFEMFKEALVNYKNADSEDKELKALNEAGAKFYKKALEIYKTKQDLIIAYHYFNQASSILNHLGEVEKQVYVEEKAAEIRDILGMSANAILKYLNSEGLNPISIIHKGESSISTLASIRSSKPVTSSLQISEEVNSKFGSELKIVETNNPEKSTTNSTEPTNKIKSIESNIEDIESNQLAQSRSEIHINDISNMKPNDKIRKKIREEFIRGRQKGPEIKGNPRSVGEMAHLSDESFSSVDEDLNLEKEEIVHIEKSVRQSPSYKPVKKGSILNILQEQGYIKTGDSKGEELQNKAEYEILSIIIKNHPISLEDIEPKTNVSSIPLYLSNLTADGLVKQTNDYQYTITEAVEQGLKGQFTNNLDPGIVRDTNE